MPKPRATRPLRAVTFDCWGTLIHEPDPAAGDALRARLLFEHVRPVRPELELAEVDAVLRAAHQRHVHLWIEGIATGAPDIAGFALETLGVRDPGLVARVAEDLAHAGLAQEVRALRGAGETLEALARSGVRLALVCDTGVTPGRVVRELLGRSGLLECLEVLIFSDEVGVPKPHPRPFRAALEALGVTPEEAVHVGDLRRTDVAGGRDVGMRTVRIRDIYDDPSRLPDADRVVDSHAELRQLLDAPDAWPHQVEPRHSR